MILLGLLSACAGPVEDSVAACDGASAVTWEAWGDGFFRTYCRSCHSADTPDRRGAPEGSDFDTLEQVVATTDRIRVRVLDEQTMPVGGGVGQDDLDLLEDFLACGIPPTSD